MAEAPTKLPIRNETKAADPAVPGRGWTTFDSLRHEIDRVFDAFHTGWRFPFPRSAFDVDRFLPRETSFAIVPAVDVVEKDTAYEITAELPGMDDKDVELKLANGTLTIKGEKKGEREEKEKDYYLCERNYGAFQRAFRVPDGIDEDKIAASFTKGVLTVTLPKTAQAQQAEKKIAVKAA
jgi:HSP20 family protein